MSRIVVHNHLPRTKDAASEQDACVAAARTAGFRMEGDYGEMGRPAKHPMKEASRREQGTGLTIEKDGSWELVTADTLSTLATGRGASSLMSAISRLMN